MTPHIRQLWNFNNALPQTGRECMRGSAAVFSVEHLALLTKLIIHVYRWTWQSFPHALLLACGSHSVRDSSLVCPYGLFIRWRRRLVLSLQTDFNRELDHPLMNAMLSQGGAKSKIETNRLNFCCLCLLC